MRILFALPGLHRIDRGAEIAFISIANELSRSGDLVTLIGSGEQREATLYRFLHAASVPRERFESCPSMPLLRNDCIYEELTFVPGLLRSYKPSAYDITVTCSYPFTNWTLRRPIIRGCRPRHVFVTQNGDWPALAKNSEYRFFGCDGLVCTNPDFYERNTRRWRCRLIPNGVDCSRFRPGEPHHQQFGLPSDRLIVLMVSALIPSKQVDLGIDSVSRIPNAHLVVAGDGPLRHIIEMEAERLLPGRFTRVVVAPEWMPTLYRSADIFLHLSREEAFGNVFLEAMASGLPIVAFDSPRIRWIVGENEFLLPAVDPDTIARQIARAREIGHGQRHERAKKAARFGWAKIGNIYREFFEEILHSPRCA